MNNKYTEVELRFPLLNPEQLIQRLNKIAKPQKQKVFQKDIYFVPVHRNFLDREYVNEWLRIRETKNRTTLNYKNWYPDKICCDEFETEIEDIIALKKIFESLNFKEIVVVEKLRSAWIYKEVEIVIDEIKGLGFFVELESKSNLEFEEAKKLLYDVLKELEAETGLQELGGYAFLLLKKKGLLKAIK